MALFSVLCSGLFSVSSCVAFAPRDLPAPSVTAGPTNFSIAIGPPADFGNSPVQNYQVQINMPGQNCLFDLISYFELALWVLSFVLFDCSLRHNVFCLVMDYSVGVLQLQQHQHRCDNYFVHLCGFFYFSVRPFFVFFLSVVL